MGTTISGPPESIDPNPTWTIDPSEENPRGVRVELTELAEALGSDYGGTPTIGVDQITKLKRRVAKLEQELSQRPHHYTIYIQELMEEGYSLERDIPLTIEQVDDDNFYARWAEANIATRGDTAQEAITNLKSLILDYVDDLLETPDEKVAGELRRQKEILFKVVTKNAD